MARYRHLYILLKILDNKASTEILVEPQYSKIYRLKPILKLILTFRWWNSCYYILILRLNQNYRCLPRPLQSQLWYVV